jgi:8-oxo-dGTP diphosphatase
MKLIHVSCALLLHEGKTLAAKRGPQMNMPGKWEFPGGKIEDGETPEQCLMRELREELSVEIAILRAMEPREYAYPNFAVRLYPFVAKITKGELTLREHAEIRWLYPWEMGDLNWAEADIAVVEDFMNS